MSKAEGVEKLPASLDLSRRVTCGNCTYCLDRCMSHLFRFGYMGEVSDEEVKTREEALIGKTVWIGIWKRYLDKVKLDGGPMTFDAKLTNWHKDQYRCQGEIIRRDGPGMFAVKIHIGVLECPAFVLNVFCEEEPGSWPPPKMTRERLAEILEDGADIVVHRGFNGFESFVVAGVAIDATQLEELLEEGLKSIDLGDFAIRLTFGEKEG